ncbi:hypothetical protein EV359DRAFT_67194 [Lentinula novae-zelandiae]|nr:hypothetical protein EV359DRAFT_67194 [Lentinula novae-zelandiae]
MSMLFTDSQCLLLLLEDTFTQFTPYTAQKFHVGYREMLTSPIMKKISLIMCLYGTSKIPKRPLVALSIMILEWKQYYSNASHTFMADVENVEAQKSILEDLAEKMA